MAENTQAAPPLEDVVEAFLTGEAGVDGIALEAALERRRTLVGEADPDKCIRAGRALQGFTNIARRLGANVGQAEEELEVMDVEKMRDALAVDLTYAINGAGEYADLDTLELAKVIRDLTEAYVRLGGELVLMRPVKGPVTGGELPPIRTNDDLILGIWRRLNEAGVIDGTALPTGTIDGIVAIVREELEAPVSEERQA